MTLDPIAMNDPNDSPPASPWLEAARMLSYITTGIAIMLLCGGLAYLADRFIPGNLTTLAGFGLGGYLGVKYLITATAD